MAKPMPRPKPARQSTRKAARTAGKKPALALLHQRVHKPLSQPFMMAREHVLAQLQESIASCEELFRSHGEGCSCEACCVVSNMVGSLRVFHMMLAIS